mgnify:CR=1 FL=1
MTASADLEPPLEHAANDLAAAHMLGSSPPRPLALLERIAETKRWFEVARKACVDPPPHASKAAEWLLDNDYHVYRALQQIGKDLAQTFYRQLAALGGDREGIPRIYDLATEYLRASHLQISPKGLAGFVDGYQRHRPLSIAEIWALPTMLRIASVEFLVTSMDRLLALSQSPPFTADCTCLETLSLDPTERVARSIANLATVASISWKDFFDSVSLVERILSRDPTHHYPQMDFDTRDRYRKAVERIARGSGWTETDVAEAALRCARAMPSAEPSGHVGYWLIDRGRPALERELGISLSLGERMRRVVLDNPGKFYASALVLGGLGVLIPPALYLARVGSSLEGWIGAMIVSTVPASILAITALHWTITRLLPPSVLPKLDYRRGLPENAKCFVVVPVVIGSDTEIAGLSQQLETHWLANVDARVHVALLVDLADALDGFGRDALPAGEIPPVRVRSAGSFTAVVKQLRVRQRAHAVRDEHALERLQGFPVEVLPDREGRALRGDRDRPPVLRAPVPHRDRRDRFGDQALFVCARSKSIRRK